MRYIFLLILMSVPGLTGASEHEQSPGIDPEQITVSGISAGAYMAHQLHIAYPEIFSGAGIIAGGPFGCAEGSLTTAMSRCMASVNTPLPVPEFAEQIRVAARDGMVGDYAALADDPVWIFHGALDSSVAGALSEALVALYSDFIPTENIRYVNHIEAAHNFPTRGQGTDCSAVESPFIGDCDFDAAGELLQYLYGELESPAAKHKAELTEVTLTAADAAGMAETAYLYVPPACHQAGQSCKAHLVLHGCGQSGEQIGTTFIKQSGYLAWAEANNIVLAFPQVAPAAANPVACWDWWGYTGSEYRWRNGAQMKVLADWILRLSIP